MFPWDGRDENRKSYEGLIQVYSRDSSLEYIEDFWERRPGKEPFIINSHSILVLEPFGTSLNILIEFKFISKQRYTKACIIIFIIIQEMCLHDLRPYKKL